MNQNSETSFQSSSIEMGSISTISEGIVSEQLIKTKKQLDLLRKDYNKLYESFSEMEAKKKKIEDEYRKMQQKSERLENYYENLIRKLKKSITILKQKNQQLEKRQGKENFNEMNVQKHNKNEEKSQEQLYEIIFKLIENGKNKLEAEKIEKYRKKVYQISSRKSKIQVFDEANKRFNDYKQFECDDKLFKKVSILKKNLDEVKDYTLVTDGNLQKESQEMKNLICEITMKMNRLQHFGSQ